MRRFMSALAADPETKDPDSAAIGSARLGFLSLRRCLLCSYRDYLLLRRRPIGGFPARFSSALLCSAALWSPTWACVLFSGTLGGLAVARCGDGVRMAGGFAGCPERMGSATLPNRTAGPLAAAAVRKIAGAARRRACLPRRPRTDRRGRRSPRRLRRQLEFALLGVRGGVGVFERRGDADSIANEFQRQPGHDKGCEKDRQEPLSGAPEGDDSSLAASKV